MVLIPPFLILPWVVSSSSASSVAAANDDDASSSPPSSGGLTSPQRADAGCGFHLSTTTAAGLNGSVGQLSSGQARTGTTMTPSLFTWFGDDFVDQQSRGCWWTPPTTVLQCDANQSPDHGFAIGCDGQVSYDGQTVFWECPTGDGDECDVYLEPMGSNCSQITITADNCRPSVAFAFAIALAIAVQGGLAAWHLGGLLLTLTLALSLSLPLSSRNRVAQSRGPIIARRIVAERTAALHAAHGSHDDDNTTDYYHDTNYYDVDIIIVGNPDVAYGANAGMAIQVSPNASSIFNFAFADADLGRTCELYFTLPPPPPSNASPADDWAYYYLSGTGVVFFAAADGWATPQTTYNSAPRVEWPLDNVVLRSGSNGGGNGNGGTGGAGTGGTGGMTERFGEFACPGGAAQTSIVMMEAPMADTCFDCRQGSVAEQIGLRG
ncbi:hypothetical protein GGR56DRAFT_675946 [Xylariaceae sp. FL0804]|nr:hypothetical protein GGR56DRAFT_675946 [Xylariaceae sp. FL0804]